MLLKKYAQTYLDHLVEEKSAEIYADVFRMVETFLQNTPTLPIPTVQGLYDILDKSSAPTFASYLTDDPGEETFITIPYIYKLILGPGSSINCRSG